MVRAESVQPIRWWWLETVASAPEQTALVTPDGDVITRAALSSAVRAAALFLRDQGIVRSDRLALAYEPGPNQAATLLAGIGVAAVAPLPQTGPTGTVEDALRRLKATIVIVDRYPSADVLEAAGALGVPVLRLEPFALPPAPSHWLCPSPAPDDIALLMQSSGTTSRPKVAPLTHANLLAGARAIADILALAPSDRTLAAMPLFHIHGIVATLMAPLMAGGSVICCRERDADQLLNQLSSLRPTWLSASPTLLLALVDAAERRSERPTHQLRFLRSVTMPLAPAARLRLETVFRVPVIEVYGMTEASSQVCSGRLPGSGVEFRPGSVGAAAGPEVTVLTPTGAHCPPGVAGEVAIRGPSVTRGYEEADHSGWILDDQGDQWFLTGDQGYLDDHGCLTLTGRLKEMVNRGGMKVSPLRVDEALSLHPAVKEALAFAVPHPTLGEDLMAAVVRHAGAFANEQQLREHLIERLPAHEVPSGIFFVETLPRGATGKLQRMALAGLLANERPSASSAAEGDLEHVVASIFAEALRLETASRDANFFQLGGDSLSSLGVIHRLEQRLGIELSPTLMVLFPSVRSLSHHLNQLLSDAAPISAQASEIPAASALPNLGDDGFQAFPASFGQTRLWFLHQAERERTAYHLIAVWRLRGDLHRDALDQALTALIERHPTLRTSFRLQADRLLQIIHPPARFKLDADFSGDHDPHRIIDAWAKQEASTPFDLESGLLIRGRLLAVGPQEHILMLNHHHIASDGWSRTVLADDLAALYNSLCEGSPPKLNPLTTHYQDYAAWQRGRLQGSRLQELQNYWTKQLTGLEPLKLPTDEPHRLETGHEGASVSFDIEAPLLNRFEALCRSEAATLHMGFLATIALLLHHRCQQDDFAIGVPIWGRTHPSLEPMIGFFVNTLPIRASFAERQTFRQLLTQVRDTSIEAYANQDLPFEQIVKTLKIERQAARNPIFQVMLQFFSAPVASLNGMKGLQAERLRNPPGAARFDLEFLLRRKEDGGLAGELIYDTSYFHAGGINRLVAGLLTLFKAIIDEPDTASTSLDLTPISERASIEGWQEGASVKSMGQTVDALFAQQVDRNPAAIALIFEKTHLTYAELDLRSACLAQRLAGLGVGPDFIVAVSIDRSVELLVSILAVLKAGGAYLPVDPAWPEQHRLEVLESSRARLIVTDKDLTANEAAMRLQRIHPNELQPLIHKSPAPFDGHAKPDTLAYVLYTSGSTGRPKGVAMPHGPLVNLLEWQGTCSEGNRRTLQFASPGFDVSFQEIFSTWTSGGTLVLAPDHVRRDPSALLKMLESENIERLFLPVVMLEYLAQAAELAKWYPTSLREVFVAGEPLRITPTIRRFFVHLRGCKLWNHYGPTETHVASAYLLGPDPALWPEHPPIGRPIFNTQIYVLDRFMNVAPMGVAGEICIGGAAVARGYLQDPNLTDARFVANPFRKSSHERLYRTGDRGYWQESGELAFLGRTDRQVKIRGHRVELGAVETAITSHPDVYGAAAVANGDKGASKALIGFAIAHPEKNLNSAQLRAWLRARLPAHMIPTQIHMVSELPLNPNGKVDHKQLENRAQMGRGPQGLPDHATGVSLSASLPATLLEEEIARIWRMLFNTQEIDRASDFFELGGDSLMAARLALELERLLGHPISIAMLFSAPTIKLLAQRLSEEAWIPRWTSIVALQPNGSRIPLFIVHGMGGDVFHFAHFARALAPDQPVYGLRCKDADKQELKSKTVEDLASSYADEIRALRPEGPYVIGGYSVGGWFAYAVATDLKRQGRDVKVILFDTYPHCRTPWPAAGARHLTNALRLLHVVPYEISKLAALPPKKWLRYFLSHPRVLHIQSRISRVFRSEKSVAACSTGAVPQLPWDDGFVRAVSRYRPHSIKCEVEFFLAPSPFLTLPLNIAKVMFWRLLVRGPVRVHKLSCRHSEIFSSVNIPKLAQNLDATLSDINRSNQFDAQASGESGPDQEKIAF